MINIHGFALPESRPNPTSPHRPPSPLSTLAVGFSTPTSPACQWSPFPPCLCSTYACSPFGSRRGTTSPLPQIPVIYVGSVLVALPLSLQLRMCCRQIVRSSIAFCPIPVFLVGNRLLLTVLSVALASQRRIPRHIYPSLRSPFSSPFLSSILPIPLPFDFPVLSPSLIRRCM